MSRRNQSTRRKSYGRRQHELRERQDRQTHEEGVRFELDSWGSATHVDAVAFVDPRLPRATYAGE